MKWYGYPRVTTYESAMDRLHEGIYSRSKEVAKGTKIVFMKSRTIMVIYYGREIVQLFPKEVGKIGFNPAYDDPSDRERINMFLPWNYRIFRDRKSYLISPDMEERMEIKPSTWYIIDEREGPKEHERFSLGEN